MSAAVVRREQLDVFVAFAPIHFVFNPVIREVHLTLEIGQVVLARPVADLFLAAVRPSVAVRSIAVVVLQELLVLAFEVLLEDDASDLEIRMLVSEARFLLAERRVEIRIVVDLAGAADAGVKRLLGPAVALQGVRVEQIASLFGESQAAFVAAKFDGLDKAFIAEVAKGIVVGVEVLFGHNSERADGCERAAVLAIQLVDSVAVEDQLAFIAARQVHVAHQSVTPAVIVSVPIVIGAGSFVAAIQITVIARIVASSVRHRPSLAHSSRRLGCP
jgi:hypothetical protein